MAACQVTVLYPNTSDAIFNLDYFLKTHMPLVQQQFGPYGFQGYSVLKLNGTPDPNKKAPYSIQATLLFDSAKDFEAALGATAETVLGDVPNFSNKEPLLIIGEKVA